jgi:hypothetical protein
MEKLIQHKKDPLPFYSSGPTIKTDMDLFPYTRFFRGAPESDVPVIMEREAGWKSRQDKCYNVPVTVESNKYYPNHCFQAAPSTVYPCYPEYLRKYSDKDKMDMQLFRKDVVEYR